MKFRLVLLAALLFLASEETAHGRKKRRYSGPAPTHPVILWSRTLDESQDSEQRKVAAFKLSQYSQPIFQTKVVSTLLKCAKDSDVQIKVLCTKALRGAKSASQAEAIRETLLSLYGAEAGLRNTVVRTLVARKEQAPEVQKVLIDALFKSEDSDELLVLLRYFEEFPATESDLSEKLVTLYEQRRDVKIRRAIVKVLTARASGQDKVIELLAACAQEKDTPLALNCLAGLQTQAKKDARAWAAVQKTLQSDDPDVLLASLDVINALPDAKHPTISKRLLELVEDVEESDIVERAVLALGVCGDQTESLVTSLQNVFKNAKTEEPTRIAAALTLGKQASSYPDTARELLKSCLKEGNSQSLKTACQLGLNELPAAP